MLTAEIQHFLRFANAAHVGTGQTAPAGDKRSSADMEPASLERQPKPCCRRLSEACKYWFQSISAETVLTIRSKYPASFWNVIRVGGRVEIIGSQALAVRLLP